ncbi:putative uncharacterized protein DDB_G0289963 [Aplysia californica]|uniref:Uncharacterized protein n=1 Tax=Aplysia californica TaxID=6500 RepID=A0ABM1VPI7_APLCA|nr:putative uncharacterized protein DDB_G0289963 [Aplysia californica]XP_035824329.1 putative uncharacterized protein DDB_G0289963 [Aplysia californica]
MFSFTRVFMGMRKSKTEHSPEGFYSNNNVAEASKKKKRLFSFNAGKDQKVQPKGLVKNGVSSRSNERNGSKFSADQNVIFKSRPVENRRVETREEVEEAVKELEDRIAGTNELKKKPLAYEIFEDLPVSRRQYHIDGASFTSEPSLNTATSYARGPSNSNNNNNSKNNKNSVNHNNNNMVHNNNSSKSNKKKQQKLQEQQQQQQQRELKRQTQYSGSDYDLLDNEEKKRGSGMFSDLLRRDPKHSFLGSHQSQGMRPQRSASEVIRNERLAGYVPRAVSLHDASAMLFGQDKEDNPPSYSHVVRSLDRFAQAPSAYSDYDNDDDDDDDDDDIENNFFSRSQNPRREKPAALPARSQSVLDDRGRLGRIHELSSTTEALVELRSSRGRSQTDSNFSRSVAGTGNENFSLSSRGDVSLFGGSSRQVNNFSLSTPGQLLHDRPSSTQAGVLRELREEEPANGSLSGSLAGKHGYASRRKYNHDNDDDDDSAHVETLLSNFDYLNDNGADVDDDDSNVLQHFEGNFNTDDEVLY